MSRHRRQTRVPFLAGNLDTSKVAKLYFSGASRGTDKNDAPGQVAGVVAQVSIGELDEKDITPVSRIECECGKRAEYKVKRARGIVTLCGTVTVVRA